MDTSKERYQEYAKNMEDDRMEPMTHEDWKRMIEKAEREEENAKKFYEQSWN